MLGWGEDYAARYPFSHAQPIRVLDVHGPGPGGRPPSKKNNGFVQPLVKKKKSNLEFQSITSCVLDLKDHLNKKYQKQKRKSGGRKIFGSADGRKFSKFQFSSITSCVTDFKDQFKNNLVLTNKIGRKDKFWIGGWTDVFWRRSALKRSSASALQRLSAQRLRERE